MSDGEQRTWFLKPKNVNNIDTQSLAINHHKLEDLLHQTKEGRDKYKSQEEVLVQIEDFLLEDNSPSNKRIPMGQNVQFDIQFLKQLWKANESSDTYPFGYYCLDTMQIAFALDLAKKQMKDSYSLNSLTKSAGIKNEKAHSAEADVKATAELFNHLIDLLPKQ